MPEFSVKTAGEWGRVVIIRAQRYGGVTGLGVGEFVGAVTVIVEAGFDERFAGFADGKPQGASSANVAERFLEVSLKAAGR